MLDWKVNYLNYSFFKTNRLFFGVKLFASIENLKFKITDPLFLNNPLFEPVPESLKTLFCKYLTF
jgi:hypothetical protein